MSIELDLLSLLGTFDSFKKYQSPTDKLVKSGCLSPVTAQLYRIVSEYYDKYGDTRPLDWAALHAWATLMGKTKPTKREGEAIKEACANIAAHTMPAAGDDIVMRLQSMDVAERLLPLLEDMAATGDPDKLMDAKAMIDTACASAAASSTEPFVTSSIEDILKHHVSGGGLDWRFDEMNVMAGPIRFGDLVIVFGRPEVGKTSFVISELMHWLQQLGANDKAVIFNNEEGGSKLVLRAYTTTLNMSSQALSKVVDPLAAFVKANGGDKLLVYDDSGLSIRDVERVCESIKPRIIVFNVLDKVLGFDKLNETERLRRVAVWARDLGKKHDAVVVCVGQADASAEAEKYIHMNQFYGSKTGIPGEADLMIGVGCDPNEPDYRYIHLSKNKLAGGPKTDPARSHGFATAKFDKATGRYT